MSAICTELYPCHAWNCNTCFPKRVYWLREQAASFARLAANQQFYFYTFKGFESVESASRYTLLLRAEIKRANRRYNAKKHYFFAIANHNHSGWHIHLIYNGELLLPMLAHIEPVKDLKAACQYLITNLERSRFEDYARTRRYGASSLLNTQNQKQAFKTRLRLFRYRTQIRLAVKVIVALSSFGSKDSNQCLRVSNSAVTMHRRPSINDHQPLVERPPPKQS